ncbi:MAG TPA: ribosome silencing factor [Polyangiaceae bacterium]
MSAKKRSTKSLRRPARPSNAPKVAERSAAPSEDAKRIALAAAQAALDKKANGVEILDVTGKVDYADYLVLMTGQSDRHVAAIADAVEDVVGKQGWRAISVEGLPRGQWVLIDFVDVVVHVFQEDTRALYDLDGLWMDARRIRVSDPVPGSA